MASSKLVKIIISLLLLLSNCSLVSLARRSAFVTSSDTSISNLIHLEKEGDERPCLADHLNHGSGHLLRWRCWKTSNLYLVSLWGRLPSADGSTLGNSQPSIARQNQPESRSLTLPNPPCTGDDDGCGR